MPNADLAKTGIAGLDDILFGGVPRGNVVVVAGPPGTGKTTLGLEFIYRGVGEFDGPGYGQLEDLRRATEAGFDVHLVKPVTPEALRDVLARRAVRPANP